MFFQVETELRGANWKVRLWSGGFEWTNITGNCKWVNLPASRLDCFIHSFIRSAPLPVPNNVCMQLGRWEWTSWWPRLACPPFWPAFQLGRTPSSCRSCSYPHWSGLPCSVEPASSLQPVYSSLCYFHSTINYITLFGSLSEASSAAKIAYR